MKQTGEQVGQTMNHLLSADSVVARIWEAPRSAQNGRQHWKARNCRGKKSDVWNSDRDEKCEAKVQRAVRFEWAFREERLMVRRALCQPEAWQFGYSQPPTCFCMLTFSASSKCLPSRCAPGKEGRKGGLLSLQTRYWSLSNHEQLPAPLFLVLPVFV